MNIDWDRARAGIRSLESDGSGGYSALGPVTQKGDRAYGAYQVMGQNIPQWTQEALGRQMTPEEFLKSEEAQEAVFKHRFGALAKQYGNVNDAASAWFTGRPQSQGGGAQDQLGTTGNEYVDKFSRAYAGTGALTPAGGAMSQGAPAEDPDLPAQGAQEAQGVLAQGAQMQGYQPTLTDNLDKLSAAFFMRDSPQQAQVIQNGLKDRMAAQTQALRRAQGASERWKTDKPYETKDGRWVQRQTSPSGEMRTVEADPSLIPKEKVTPPNERALAVERKNLVEHIGTFENINETIHQMDDVTDAILSGKLKLGWDNKAKGFFASVTNKADENDVGIKNLMRQTNIAALLLMQMRRGSGTNQQFAAEVEAAMPNKADLDDAAAADSFIKVTDMLRGGLSKSANGIISAGKASDQFKKVTRRDGEEVDGQEWTSSVLKADAEKGKARKESWTAFMKNRADAKKGKKPGAATDAERFDSFYN